MPVTVQSGDTLWSIAQRTLGEGQRYPEIYALNRDQLSDPNSIETGQVLRLPGDPVPGPTTTASPSAAPSSWTQSAADLWEGFQREANAALDVLEASWSAGWTFLSDRGSELEAQILAAPASFQGVVETFLKHLSVTRENLVWLKARESALSPERRQQLPSITQAHNQLAQAFLADVQDGQDLSVGVAPLLWVGVIGVGVTAIALATAQYETAQANRTWSETVRAETEARIQASAQGRTLQPSTLPPPAAAPPAPPPPSLPSSPSGSAVGGWLLVGLGLAAAAIALPPLLQAARS